MSSSPKAVIHVIVGYLGSGKTTLLRRLLAHELNRGRKVGVIVNEMADLDVDGAILDGHHGDDERCHVLGVAGGCVCCDLGDALVDALQRQIADGTEVVFVESTGVAAMPQILDHIAKAMAPHGAEVALGACVGVVDAARFMEQRSRWAASAVHLLGADVVVLNHVDEASPHDLLAVGAAVESLAPSSWLLTASFADVEPGPLLATRHRVRNMGSFELDTMAGHVQSTFLVRKPVDLAKLEALLRRYPRSMLRFKGFVFVPGDERPRTVQWRAGASRLAVEIHPKEVEVGYVSAIGRRIDWDRFADGLGDCLVRPPRRPRPSQRLLH
jgi:G3E family GTPase